MTRFLEACRVDELPVGDKRAVDLDGVRILLVNLNGKVYAVDGICTHETADLSLGILIENRLTCPLHLSSFDVTTGKVLSPPATTSLRHFQVKVEGGSIYVGI